VNAGKLADLTGGRLTGNPDAPILRGRADSRLCIPGDLYVALPGERTDGSLYVLAAWKAGADVALADERKDLPHPPEGKALVAVPDPLAALHELARFKRRESPDLQVVGITGSNGKTTTKEILASILVDWKKDSVLVTEGNYNSDIGLALTLLDLRPRHEIAVLEMGMNREGEMALLAGLAEPRIALVTNIGSAHVGLLGSREAVAAEKRKIFLGAGKKSVAVLPVDGEWNDFLLEGFPGEVRFFGEWGAGGWDSFENRGPDGFSLVRKGVELNFRLPGGHNLMNAMAAVEAAQALGVPESSILNGLKSVKPVSGRSEIIQSAVTVIRDSYNANPESLLAALELFSSVKTSGRRVLVLGELLELGHETEQALRKAGGAAAGVNPDAVFLFGKSLGPLKKAVSDAGYRGSLSLYTEMAELQDALSGYLKAGDLVLLKGSRGSALERLDQIIGEVGSG